MLRHPTRRALAASLALVLAVLPTVLLADGRFSKARLLVPQDNGKAQEVEGTFISDAKAKQVRFESGGRVTFEVPFDRLKSLLYEKAAKPRYGAGLLLAWPLLFTKSKKHFVTIQYTDASGQGKFEIVRLDKSNFAMALATLEADTGLKVERTEER